MDDKVRDPISASVWDWFRAIDSPGPSPQAVPPELKDSMPGAEVLLREWVPYRLHIPDATELLVNNVRLQSEFQPGYFTLKFENQLGATTLTPLIHGIPQESRHVEVIAGKFGSVHESVRFTNAVVQQLSAHVSTLPFVVHAATARQIERQHREPNAFFAFHYVRHHADRLIHALQIITADPHRKLGDVVEDVRIHQARKIDAEALHSLLTGPRAGVPGAKAGAAPLERLQPLRIRQRRPVETWDTAENRFVVAVCQRVSSLLDSIERMWWFDAHALPQDHERHRRLRRASRLLLRSERFTGLPASLRMPAYSRVLQNKAGYRDLTAFWNGLTQVHHPVLARLSRAVDLRDIPTLYEYWLFFEMAGAIAAFTGVPPQYPTVMDPYAGQQNLWAKFNGYGELRTQVSLQASVYTGIPLRPDLVWTTEDGRSVVLDAKFAMSSVGELAEEDETVPTSWATSRDVTKMHAYRDAIDRVDAALVLFPGTRGSFWQADGKKRHVHSLNDVLEDVIEARLSGVGAVPMKPASEVSNG